MPAFSIDRWLKGGVGVEPGLEESALKGHLKVLKNKGNIDGGYLGAVTAAWGRVGIKTVQPSSSSSASAWTEL